MPSFGEAKVLRGKSGVSEIREALAACGIKTRIVKLGGRGCYITDFKDEHIIPTFAEFLPVDTTGAGDTFVAGFIRAMIEGWPHEAAAVFASCVASHNITKVGATAGVPDFNTVYNYVKNAKGRAEFSAYLGEFGGC
jgi:sugar/nucleoside kinase (ribokinase family)